MKVKAIVLFKKEGTPVKAFINLSQAQRYCVEKKICNAGWVKRSLETGEKFYFTPNGFSISHNGYTGFGWYVQWKMVSEEKVVGYKKEETDKQN